MTSSMELLVNFENVLYKIDVNEEDTVFDLKYSIYIATGLKPSRQTFPKLLLHGKFYFSCTFAAF